MPNSENTILTVYGKPRCVQCDATERFLNQKNIPYTKIDVTESEPAYEYVTKMGYQQVPVVVTATGDHWSGFDPDRLAVYA